MWVSKGLLERSEMEDASAPRQLSSGENRRDVAYGENVSH